MEGQVDLDRVGSVIAAEGKLPSFAVVDAAGAEVGPASCYLRDLALLAGAAAACPFRGSYAAIGWVTVIGGSQGLPSRARVMASRAVRPWARAESR